MLRVYAAAFVLGFLEGWNGPDTIEELVAVDNEAVRRIEEYLAAEQQRDEMTLAEYLRQAACAERYQRGEREWVS